MKCVEIIIDCVSNKSARGVEFILHRAQGARQACPARTQARALSAMNCNLESARILGAVDDTYAELLFLSRLAGGSGGDGTKIASDELDAHLRAYHEGDTHALHETTSALCRWLRRDPEAFERITGKRDEKRTGTGTRTTRIPSSPSWCARSTTRADG